MQQALARIAGFFNFSGALLCELLEGGEAFCVTARHGAPHSGHDLPLRGELQLDRYPHALSTLALRRPAVLALGEGQDRDGGRGQLVVFPLAVGASVLGSMSFEAPHAPAPELLGVLGVIGELFASAIQRRRAETSLAERLRFEEAISDGLRAPARHRW
jgi:GAF domain-containing protein